nr:uncharacterized protein LOC111840175 [Paramormyrops kingsleyae]
MGKTNLKALLSMEPNPSPYITGPRKTGEPMPRLTGVILNKSLRIVALLVHRLRFHDVTVDVHIIESRVNVSGVGCGRRGTSYIIPATRLKVQHVGQTNKKKLSVKATGGGPPPEAFSRAEELAVANNVGRPTMEGVEGGVQSDPGASDMCTLYVQVEGGNMQVLQPPAEPSTSCDPQVQEDLGEDTLSALSDTHIQEAFQQPPSPPVASSTRTSHTESALLLCL